MSLRNNVIKAIKRRLIDVTNLTNIVQPIWEIQKSISRVLIDKNYDRPLLEPKRINRLDPDSKTTMNTHNDNMVSTQLDSHIIRDTVIELWWKSELVDTINKNTNLMLNNLDTIITKKIKQIRRDYMIGAQTFIEHFNDTSHIKTAAGLSVNPSTKTLTLKHPDVDDDVVTMEDADVALSIDKNIPFVIPHNIKQILFPGNNTTIQTKAVMDKRDSIEITMTITFTKRPLTQIGINIVNSALAYLDVVANDNVIISNNPIVKGNYIFNLPYKEYNKIDLKFRMDTETYMEDGQFVYILSLLNVILRNVSFNSNGEMVSAPITFNSPITDLALKVNDWQPLGTTIEYLISKDNGETWMAIEPTHSIYDKPNWYPVAATSEISFISEIATSLKPDNAITGNVPIYNILDNQSNEYVNNDQLIVPSDWEIDTKHSTIQFGIDDYQVINDYIVYDKIGNITEYIFDKNDLNWHDLYITLSNQPYVVNSAQFTLQYTPLDDNIQISDGKTLYTNFTRVGRTITITQAISDGTHIYVTYKVALSEIENTDNVDITIQEDSIKLLNNPMDDEPLELTNIADILYNEKKIRLLPNADVALDTTESKYIIYVTFNYTVRSKEQYKLFKTYVYYQQSTTIDILPFTDDEIAAGNAHIIDNVNVSKYNEYTMNTGWHTIITTQPFPTNPDPSVNDVNLITGKPSNAGIILKDYSEMAAFKLDMNYVPLNKLVNIIVPSDNRSFSIHNNKIYINFHPDYPIDENSIGNKLLCRKVIWDGRVVATYQANYPKFKIKAKLKPNKNSTDAVNSFIYKIRMKRNSGKPSPIIYKLEWFGI